uniref:Capsid protein alpha n=1 Tax=Scaphoideus titanus sobemo-like virus 1 TaxID=2716557 RepID=A0A6G7NRX7_9VIRU|nr:hypothetical protein [Scaphoideus titanus sobemo-like virus 1]
MDKKFVCQADGRRFATKQALAQHRQASHGAPGQNSRKGGGSNPQPRRRQTQAASDITQVMAAQPQRVLGNSGTDMAIVSGVDRLLSVKELKDRASGSIVLDFLVVPSGFKRLARIASAFQKVQYLQLEFSVEPQINAVTAGGYVVGFVSDPDDQIVNLDQLTSTRGSVTTKWWQSARVVPKLTNRTYFTSMGSELREFSPGRFVLMVDGQASQTGNLTVFCRWSVRLSGAILEAPLPKEVTILNPVWIRNGHQGVWAKVATSVAADGWSDKPDHIIGTGWKKGAAYRLPYPVPLVKANDKQFALHHWLYIRDADSVFLAVDGPADFYEADYEIDNLVIDAGETVRKFETASAVSGEVKEGSSLDTEAMTPGPPQSPSPLSELSRELRDFVRTLKESFQPSPRPMARSTSMGSFSLMEYPPE